MAGWNPDRERKSGYHTRRISVSCRHVPARSPRDQLEAQMRKSGDTPFVVRDCSIAYDGTLFAPVSELNRMRREFLARAEEALLASSIPSDEDIARSRQRLDVAFPEHASGPSNGSDTGIPATPLALTVYADTPEAVSMAVKEGCTSICFEPAFVLPRHSCPTGEMWISGPSGNRLQKPWRSAGMPVPASC